MQIFLALVLFCVAGWLYWDCIYLQVFENSTILFFHLFIKNKIITNNHPKYKHTKLLNTCCFFFPLTLMPVGKMSPEQVYFCNLCLLTNISSHERPYTQKQTQLCSRSDVRRPFSGLDFRLSDLHPQLSAAGGEAPSPGFSARGGSCKSFEVNESSKINQAQLTRVIWQKKKREKEKSGCGGKTPISIENHVSWMMETYL